jgi:hypothetical protein
VGLAALPHFDTDTLDFGDFLHLVSIIVGSPYNMDSLLGDGPPVLIGPRDEEPGPFAIPQAFASMLAATHDEQVADLSNRWMVASVPDFAAYRRAWEGGPLWAETVKQRHETLAALVSFVRTAVSKQQGIYVTPGGA